jgi:molybdopterin converting factor small subunit
LTSPIGRRKIGYPAVGKGPMKVRFFKPFDELSGKEEIILDLKQPIQVKELLGEIEKRVPSFKPYVQKEKDEVLNYFVVLIRGDEILKLTDMVREKDTVKVLPPISGG